MSISSIDIQEQGFGTARNGYDMQEVDVFLERVATELDKMQADFEDQLAAARAEAAKAAANQSSPEQEAEIRALKAEVAKLQNQLAEQQTNESVISEAFIAAQKSANKIKDEARSEGDKVLRDADAKAKQIIGEAAGEKKRIIAEIERLETSRTNFVEEYSKLVAHFQDEAKRVFTSVGLTTDDGVINKDMKSILDDADRDYGVSAGDESYGDDAIPSYGSLGDAPKADDTMFGATGSIDIDID
ncbi:MAG: DivIVA domain-containing protein [Coriobacteriales bacterium]|jgi:cell division initiation protein